MVNFYQRAKLLNIKNMKYNNFDIIIGIPALNEESTIKEVVSVLDRGLQKYFPKKKSLIVLLDSNSSDKTVDIFNLTIIDTPKLLIKNSKRGKGRNIINLLNLSIKNNAKCICMIDADIKNINENWVLKLVSPILKHEADFIIPIYKRGKFAGNLTNLVCRPLLYGLYGLFIIQPIGGDFAFNCNYAKSLIKEIKSAKKYIKPTIYEFGIDIFMTCQCFIKGYKYQEVDLGKKIDKPGLFHIDKIFEEVCASLFYVIANTNFVDVKSKKLSIKNFLIDSKPYTDNELSEKLQFALSLIDKNKKTKRINKIYSELNMSELENSQQITSENFNNLLIRVARLLQSKNITNETNLFYIINLIRPYFHLRIYTYFREIKDEKPQGVEKKLVKSCRFIRNKMLV